MFWWLGLAIIYKFNCIFIAILSKIEFLIYDFLASVIIFNVSSTAQHCSLAWLFFLFRAPSSKCGFPSRNMKKVERAVWKESVPKIFDLYCLQPFLTFSSNPQHPSTSCCVFFCLWSFYHLHSKKKIIVLFKRLHYTLPLPSAIMWTLPLSFSPCYHPHISCPGYKYKEQAAFLELPEWTGWIALS